MVAGLSESAWRMARRVGSATAANTWSRLLAEYSTMWLNIVTAALFCQLKSCAAGKVAQAASAWSDQGMGSRNSPLSRRSWGSYLCPASFPGIHVGCARATSIGDIGAGIAGGHHQHAAFLQRWKKWSPPWFASASRRSGSVCSIFSRAFPARFPRDPGTNDRLTLGAPLPGLPGTLNMPEPRKRKVIGQHFQAVRRHSIEQPAPRLPGILWIQIKH